VFGINIHRSAYSRYKALSSTATAFDPILDKGKILSASQVSAFVVVPLGKSLVAQLFFFGTGTGTFDYRLWATFRGSNEVGVLDPISTIVMPLGGGTATLGAATGVTGGTVVGPTEKLANILTWTPSGIGTVPPGPEAVAQTALNEGASAVYAATLTTTNDIAVLILPSILRATGIIVDFDMTGATSGNCAVMVDEV